MWKLGVNDVEDARRIVRRAYGRSLQMEGVGEGEGKGKEEDEVAEKEIEAWVVETLGLKGYEEKKREIQALRAEQARREEGTDGKR